MQFQISWLLQKPTDLDLHCLQKQGISVFSRTRVKMSRPFLIDSKSDYLIRIVDINSILNEKQCRSRLVSFLSCKGRIYSDSAGQGLNQFYLIADLFLFYYERDFMLSLSHENQTNIIEAFSDLLNIY